jgi:four helix bundle protein
METSPVKEKSYRFAVEVVGCCRAIRDPSVRPIVAQFLRAGTSIGANVEEANAAQTKKDFLAKISIASKEAREARYWLRLFRDSDIVSGEVLGRLMALADELIRLLTAIAKTTREHLQNEAR